LQVLHIYLAIVFLASTSHIPCDSPQTSHIGLIATLSWPPHFHLADHFQLGPSHFIYFASHKGMSPNKRHTQHSTSRPILHNPLKTQYPSVQSENQCLGAPHHPQYKKAYLIRATQKSPPTATLNPSISIPTLFLVPLYLLLVLLSILSAILINYLTTLESCKTSVK
jgi:hypothetical protein